MTFIYINPEDAVEPVLVPPGEYLCEIVGARTDEEPENNAPATQIICTIAISADMEELGLEGSPQIVFHTLWLPSDPEAYEGANNNALLKLQRFMNGGKAGSANFQIPYSDQGGLDTDLFKGKKAWCKLNKKADVNKKTQEVYPERNNIERIMRNVE